MTENGQSAGVPVGTKPVAPPRKRKEKDKPAYPERPVSVGTKPVVPPKTKQAKAENELPENNAAAPQRPPPRNQNPVTTSRIESEKTENEIPDNNAAAPQRPPPRNQIQRLDKIWTNGYYGDEENLSNIDGEDKWIILSKKDGTLILKKGINGETYPIIGQYEVTIEETTCKGQLLSELMHDVVEKTNIGEAGRRMGATLIYERDLMKFISGKHIQPILEDKDSKSIGRGEFGDVALGRIPDDKNPNNMREVAIKRVKQTSNYAITGGMELAVMTTLSKREDYSYLLSFIGWYRDPECLYVVTEYMPNGSLHDHLKTVFLNKEDSDPKERILMHRFVCQIASGMCVMEKEKLLHRDLAARNILLDENFDIKISDFGLSRPFRSTYSSGVFAIRWAAPEVLENEDNSENNFTSKADVWSFGVLVWEIYSFGCLPYSDITSNKLKGLLRQGKRLDKPTGTPNKMFQLMHNCWQFEPEKRPSFEGIVEYLFNKSTRTSLALTSVPPPPPSQSLKPSNYRHSLA